MLGGGGRGEGGEAPRRGPMCPSRAHHHWSGLYPLKVENMKDPTSQ